MIENFGNGWTHKPPRPRPKSLRHKPYGLAGLPKLTRNQSRYIRTHSAGSLPSSTQGHTPNYTNNPRKPFVW